MGIGSANPLLLASAASGGDSGPSDPVTRSLRFESGGRLTRTFSTSNRRTFTISFWAKRGSISSSNDQQVFSVAGSNHSGGADIERIHFTNDDTIEFWAYPNSTAARINVSAKLRDPSAWAHYMMSVDTTQSTASNRIKFFINGVHQTALDNSTYPSQNYEFYINSNRTHYIGEEAIRHRYPYSGLLADFYFIDGTALSTPVGNLIEDTGYSSYKPKAFDMSSYSGNSFHIDAQPAHDADLLVSSVGRNDGDTQFADAAQGHGLVRYGSTHHDDTVGNPFDSSGTAIHFDGSGDYIKVWDGSSGDYDFGTADYTIECWVNISSSSSTNYNTIWSNSHTGLHLFERGGEFYYYTSSDGGSNPADGLTGYTTNTWYHVAAVRDGTDTRVYINGKCSLNYTWNGTTDASTSNFRIGGGDHYFLDGYIYDFRVTGGEALYSGTSTASDWANFDEITAPFELNPVYIGGDQSGNKNHFTATNLASSDVMLDTPTKNYATWNAAQKDGGSVFSEGNLKTSSVASNNYHPCQATFNLPDGTGWYAEFYVVTNDGIHSPIIGIQDASRNSSTLENIYVTKGVGLRRDGVILRDNSTVRTGLGGTSNGDIIMVAYKDRKIWFGRNGSWFHSGDPANDSNESTTANTEISGYHFAINCFVNGQTVANFGQDPTFAGNKTSGQDTSQSEFYYAPPTGFKSLNTSNLDDPTVTASENFDILTYTGNSDVNYGSGSTQNVTGVNFDVGMAWIKDRDNSSSGYTYSGYDEYGHYLFDTVTGTSSGGYNLDGDVVSSGSGPYLNSGYYGVTSFSAGSGTNRGITVDEAGETNFDYDDGYYQLTERYVAWLWKLGSTGSSSTWNSSYTAPSTEHYNADAGVTTIEVSPASSGNLEVAHSLSAAPEFFFVGHDSYPNFTGYPAFHKDLTSGYYLQLDGSSAQSSDSTYFPSGAAHADYIKLGSVFADSYGYGGNLRIWAFTGVENFSKFGKYTGNGFTSGPMVYCGFRPKFFMYKQSTGTTNWVIVDAERETYNTVDLGLFPNLTSHEQAGSSSNYKIDFLSNGVKIRTSASGTNANNQTFIYAAFAESPFKHASAR